MRYVVSVLLMLAGCHAAPVPHADCGVAPPGFAVWDISAMQKLPIEAPIVNTVHIGSGGATTWNGVRLDGLEDMSSIVVLDQYLALTAQLNPRPLTTLTFDKGVSCARIAIVRRLMAKHLHCNTDAGCFQGPIPH